MCLLDVDKSKLEMVMNVNVSQTTAKDGGLNTLRRSTSLRKFKGPAMITLVFHEYSDFVEWSFKLKNVLGKYYSYLVIYSSFELFSYLDVVIFGKYLKFDEFTNVGGL